MQGGFSGFVFLYESLSFTFYFTLLFKLREHHGRITMLIEIRPSTKYNPTIQPISTR